jgi:pSer/pThr/pTyr-binding forkhead associated (FHA) protein
MADSSRYKLIVHEEGGTREIELGPEPAVIGRSGESTVQIDHSSISRKHSELRCSADGVEVRDLGSSNGTLVNGERVETQIVRAGDQIRFGQVRAEIVTPDASTPPDAGEIQLEEISIETPAGAESSDYVLVVLDGESQGERFPLEKRRLVLGRSGSCDIRLKGLGVSGTHAEIVWTQGSPVLRDLDSTNGVLQAGRRVNEVTLKDGLTLGIGKVGVRCEGPVEEIEIGADLDVEPTADTVAADETLQFRDLTDTTVPRRRKVGAVIGITILLVGLAAAAYFYFAPTSSKRIGRRLAGTVEAPKDSLLQSGFSAEEADIADLWPLDDPKSGGLSRSVAAKRLGRFGFALERSKEADPGSPTLAILRQSIPVDGRRRYTLEGWARCPEAGIEATLMIRFLDSAGEVVQQIFGSRIAADPDSGPGAYQHVDVSPTVPTGCGRAQVGLVVSGAEGTAFFDDIALRPSELKPRPLVHALDRFNVEFAPHGSWGLRIDRHWPLRCVEYFLTKQRARFFQESHTRPTGDGLVLKEGEAKFQGDMQGPDGADRPIDLTVQGTDLVTFTYQPRPGAGVEREGLRFFIRSEDLKRGILVSTGADVSAQAGPFSLEACHALVIGTGTRKIRVGFNPPLNADLEVEGSRVQVRVWRRHNASEAIAVRIDTSLTDLLARANTALARGREAMNDERFGDAYRHLNEVIRDFAVKKEDVDEAQRLILEVQARFREQFERLKKRADYAMFFKDLSEVNRVLADCIALQSTYRDTPVENEASSVVSKLEETSRMLRTQRIKDRARTLLLLARDAQERGDVRFAEEYYTEVIERFPGTAFESQAKTELEAMRKVASEVEKGVGKNDQGNQGS